MELPGHTHCTSYLILNPYILEPYILRCLDISNPVAPVELGVYQLEFYYTQDIFVNNNVAYIATQGNGVLMIDISNPAAPTQIGKFIPTDGVYGDLYSRVDVVDNIAYITGNRGLHLVNVSDPTAPFEIGRYKTEANATSIYVKGHIAYVINQNTLTLVDVTNPHIPTKLGVHSLPDWATSIYVNDNNTAYITTTGYGLHLVDVSNPTQPIQMGIYSTPYASGVYIDKNIIYVADRIAGLLMFRDIPPKEVFLPVIVKKW